MRWVIRRGWKMWSKPWPVVTEPPLRFFFYGTLTGGGALGAPVRAALVRLRDLGPARVSGSLHAISDPQGWYPALVEGAGSVAGRLYEAGPGFSAADLAALDAYEDCDPGNLDVSLYRREVLACGAQAYLFNLSLPSGARPIPDGDFAAWIAAEGLPIFADQGAVS